MKVLPRTILAAGTLTIAMSLSPTAHAQPSANYVYGYAAILGPAGNHYVPLSETSYPPGPYAGYIYFDQVEFRFTVGSNPSAAPIVIARSANDPGVGNAGWRQSADGRYSYPTAWLIKAELIPGSGGPPGRAHQLCRSSRHHRWIGTAGFRSILQFVVSGVA